MIDFFVFPFKFTDMLDETADSRYRISSPDNIAKMDERHILRTLNEIEKAVFDDFTMIKESDRFDFLFFWIKHLEEKKESYPIEYLESTADLLISSLERIFKTIEEEENKNSLAPNFGAIEDLRVCFKMNLFLMFYFLKNTRVKKSKNSLKDEINEAAQIQSSKTDKRKNKSTRNKKDMSNETLEQLLKKQKKCLICLEESLEVDFKYLWNKRQIDGELFKYYVETCLTMLESKVLLKDIDVKTCIFGILEYVLAEFPEALKNVQIKFINLIYDDENIVEPIADFIIKGYRSEKGNMSKLATETLMMLVNYVVERTNVNNESQAVKNTKEFLCRVSDCIPKMFYNNLSSFIVLYDSEAYLLRNSLNEIISNIIKKVLTTVEDESDMNNLENHNAMKKKLLDKLLLRVYDKHAFCRSHILGILSGLCEGNTVPRDYLFDIFKKACDRIKDVSAHVRKKAIQLLMITMQYYFAIYVESQKQIEIKKFLSKEKIEKDLNNNKMEEADIKNGIAELEESLKEIIDPLKPELQEIHADIKALKRKHEHCMNMRKCLQEYREMLVSIEEICPNLEVLLGSKNIGDVVETIKLLTFLSKTNVESSRAGVKKMLVLIWSKDKAIKEEVLKAYWQLVFDPKVFDSKNIANNLITLLNESTLTEATSLEEMLNFLLDWNNQIEEKDREKKKDLFQIPTGVYKNLWENFIIGLKDSINSRKEARASLQLLRICCSKSKEAWAQKFDNFQSILLSFRKNKQKMDWIIVKEISLIVEKSIEPPGKLLQTFILLLIEYQGHTDTEWFCAAEQIINMIFSFKKDPEDMAKSLILKCTRFLYEKKENLENPTQTQTAFNVPGSPDKNTQSMLENPGEEKMMIEEENSKPKDLEFEMKLAQLLFIVGHVAIKYLIYIDNYENDLKRLKNEAETKYQANQKDSNNEDLEKIHGGLEAEYEKKIEMLHQISEHDLLKKNLLGSYIPFIKKICKDILEEKRINVNPILDRAVLMTLCKFMCVSGEFCKENLETLFKLMNSNIDPTIKNNIIVSLGDIMHRYPNIIEPFTNHIYQNLRDKEATVRKTTLLVITHLILNDMLKLKGEICDVALLLEDKDPKIQNLVRLLFHELHKKNPQIIYNLLPEAIGRMSKICENSEKENFLQVEENSFQNFARNVMPYLEKDKYSESLVEKLCVRFKNTKNEKEWRNTAFCLSLLAFNEKGLRKLLELYENYREKLNDPAIMDCFKIILSKLKKNCKADIKNMVEEWESKLNNYTVETMEEKRKVVDKSKKLRKPKTGDEMILEEVKEDAEKENSVKNVVPRSTNTKNQKKVANKKKTSKSHKKNDFIEDDDDEDKEDDGDMEFENEQSGESVALNKRRGKNAENNSEMLRERPKRNVVNRKQYMEIEEEEEEGEQVEVLDDNEEYME